MNLFLPDQRLAAYTAKFIKIEQHLQKRLNDVFEAQPSKSRSEKRRSAEDLRRRAEQDAAYCDYIQETLAAYLSELCGRAFEDDCEWRAHEVLAQGQLFRRTFLLHLASSRGILDQADYARRYERSIDSCEFWLWFLDEVRRLAEWEASGDHCETAALAKPTIKRILEDARARMHPNLSKEKFALKMGLERSVFFDLQAGKPVSDKTYRTVADYIGTTAKELKSASTPTEPTD